MPYLCLWRHNFCAAGGVLLWFCQRNWAHPRFLWIIPPAYCQICRKQVYLQHKSKHSFLHRTPLTTYLPTDSEKPPRRGIDILPPCLAVCFFTVSHGGSISAFKQVPKPTLISALKKKLRREYNLRPVNLRCSKACKPNSNSNALRILSLDDVALDYDGAIKTYTGSGTDLVIGMEGAALYASSPNALEVLLGEALAKTWANRYNKNTDIVL